MQRGGSSFGFSTGNKLRRCWKTLLVGIAGNVRLSCEGEAEKRGKQGKGGVVLLAVILGRKKSPSSARFWTKAPLSQDSCGCACRGGRPGRGHGLVAWKVCAKGTVKGREAAQSLRPREVKRSHQASACSSPVSPGAEALGGLMRRSEPCPVTPALTASATRRTCQHQLIAK